MRRRSLLGGMAALTALAGCKVKEDRPAGPLKIRFATDWRAQAEHGGFYQAVAMGEYARRGLDVTIVPGGPGVNVPQMVATGAVDLGMGSNSFIVLNLAKEQIPVKAVAAFFQKDPQVLMAHPDPKLKSIADLKGRPFLLADASIDAFWVWLKARYGFTDAQVRKYNYNSAPFIANPQAVQQGYVTSEPYTIEKTAGFKPAVFLLADEGYPSYATMALASDKTIAERPDMVRRFVQASAAGWSAYLNGDASAADRMILKDNPEMTQDLLTQARAKLKAYGLVDGGDAKTLGVGAMTDARWAEFFAVAAGEGVYPKTLDYKRAYTLDFVRK
jgi:NitT/TauT family transport system substrate-binding protein